VAISLAYWEYYTRMLDVWSTLNAQHAFSMVHSAHKVYWISTINLIIDIVRNKVSGDPFSRQGILL
jgi:hypothetical protein